MVADYPDPIRFDYGGARGGVVDVTHAGTTEWSGTSFAAPFAAAEILRYAADRTGGDPVEAWRQIKADRPFVVFAPDWLS